MTPALVGEPTDLPLRGELHYVLELEHPVESSHPGMSVNRAVYRVLAEFLEEPSAWSG